MLPFQLAPVSVICGHYGVGKTNFALNLALDAAGEGYGVTLVDLDVVNPYFRSSEFRELLEQAGVRLVSPVFAEAGSNVDVPSLTGGITAAVDDAYAAFRAADADPSLVIVDVGGDDAGATALARFSPQIAAGSYQMLYVVNRFRSLTQTPEQAVAVLREIESKARLKVTGIVSNTNLKAETTEDSIVDGARFACSVAEAANVPLLCVTVPYVLARQEKPFPCEGHGCEVEYPVRVIVKAPWE